MRCVQCSVEQPCLNLCCPQGHVVKVVNGISQCSVVESPATETAAPATQAETSKEESTTQPAPSAKNQEVKDWPELTTLNTWAEMQCEVGASYENSFEWFETKTKKIMVGGVEVEVVEYPAILWDLKATTGEMVVDGEVKYPGEYCVQFSDTGIRSLLLCSKEQ